MCTYRGSSYLQFATMADITVMTLWVVPSCDDVYLPLLTLWVVPCGDIVGGTVM